MKTSVCVDARNHSSSISLVRRRTSLWKAAAAWSVSHSVWSAAFCVFAAAQSVEKCDGRTFRLLLFSSLAWFIFHAPSHLSMERHYFPLCSRSTKGSCVHLHEKKNKKSNQKRKKGRKKKGGRRCFLWPGSDRSLIGGFVFKYLHFLSWGFFLWIASLFFFFFLKYKYNCLDCHLPRRRCRTY